MSKLIQFGAGGGAFAEDAFAAVADDAALPDGSIVVSLRTIVPGREVTSVFVT